MTAIPPGFTATELRIKAAAEAYAAEFMIPISEVREWYASAADKEKLVCYMEDMVEREREWRRKIVAEMRARNAEL